MQNNNDKDKSGVFSRLKLGLKKTSGRISSLFTGNYIDDNFWEELEDTLILSDMGVEIVTSLLESVRGSRAAMKDPASLLTAIKAEAVKLFPPAAIQVESKPYVMLVIGVNGAGKTTTIAKIASRYKGADQRVLLGAADTFRAAAIDQLKNWADRIDIPIITREEGADPAAVAFDTVQSAVSKDMDIAIIDTAGRLHTKHNLMEELKKINRVMAKALPSAPHEVLLVLDGTAGQNALTQARAFNEAIPVTSLAITKLDGTAKGGIVLRIANELKIPVKYVGVGEKPEDMIPFDAVAYVDAIFSS